MMQIKTRRLVQTMLLVFLAFLACGANPALGDSIGINFWTSGRIPYKFDDGTLGPVAVHPDDQAKIEAQMLAWELATTFRDPTGAWRQYIDFWPCGDKCSGNYLVIRYNRLNPDGSEAECNNMPDPVGMELRDTRDGNPDGITELHFTRTNGTCPGSDVRAKTTQAPRIILHELGHTLGIWHEFNRIDADRWLRETPEVDGDDFERAFGTKANLLPALGNFDYDSIVSYGSSAPLPSSQNQMVTNFLDALRNTIDKAQQGAVVSKRDVSRVLQYYAYERYPGWGFFTSLSSESREDPDELPNPFLAPGVEAVGSPAIASQSPGNYDIFTRGSDGQLYWKAFRTISTSIRPSVNVTPYDWRPIGRGFGSDPSAVSRGPGKIDVVAINDQGELQRIKYIGGNWDRPLTIRGGYPTGGIKKSPDGGYIGPAIASRGADSLDVFVVVRERLDGRTDGRLAVTTLTNGNWETWQTLGADYHVTARPAAVALSSTEVQLAINESNSNLYEPLATFKSAEPSFDRGVLKGTTASQTPPALTSRSGIDRYRVLIANAQGRISHRVASGAWWDIGGIAKPGTGPSAVATGGFGFKAIMHGEDATGCDLSCSKGYYPSKDPVALATNPLALSTDPLAPRPGAALIQRGILWIRHFE